MYEKLNKGQKKTIKRYVLFATMHLLSYKIDVARGLYNLIIFKEHSLKVTLSKTLFFFVNGNRLLIIIITKYSILEKNILVHIDEEA